MTKIIAEAGTCHADSDPAKRVYRALFYALGAWEAGADFVKFQMFAAPIKDDMFCWIEGDEEREPRWLDSCMSLDDWRAVKSACDTVGIGFIASVFQDTTVDWLRELGVGYTKVASRAARDFPYERATGQVIVSNGMYPVPENDDYIVMQCEANYPSKTKWTGEFPGFSDHSGSNHYAYGAMCRGCEWIEVHFFINPEDAGPDRPASLNLPSLKQLCRLRDSF